MNFHLTNSFQRNSLCNEIFYGTMQFSLKTNVISYVKSTTKCIKTDIHDNTSL